jgi:chain length determinant protein EpsF
MTFTQFLIVLRARWKLAFGIWASIVGLIVGLSVALLLYAPKYTASAAVVVDTKSVDPIAGVMQGGGLLPGYMATQVDVAQSERVVLRAIRTMKLAENAELRQQWIEVTEGRGNFDSWLSDVVLKKYDVRPSRESSALSMAYTAADPAFAAQMTNALVQAYIDTTLELRTEPAKQYNTFFDERAKQARDALEQAQAKLSAFQRSKGLLATDERFDVENARLIELSSQVTGLQTAAAEATGRQAQAGATPERMQEVLNNPVVYELSRDVSRLEAKLQELKSRLGDEHPQVREAQSSLTELQKRLGEATQRASGSVGVSSNVAVSRLAQSRAALETQRARVLQLKAQRDEASVLQRDVESAQRSYDLVLARLSQTDMESRNQQTNVSLLKSATVPAFPSSPKVVLNTAVAVVLGLLLAVAGALLREMGDRRLRTEEDVNLGFNLPLLATVPRVALGRRGNSSRLAAMKARVLSGAPRLAGR